MLNYIKIRRYFSLRKSIVAVVLLCLAAIMLIHPRVSSAQSITWKLFLNSSYTQPLLSDITTAGERFIIDSSKISGSYGGTEELLDALDGISYSVDRSPVTEPLTLNIIMKVRGNEFQSVIGVDAMIYFELEAIVNGSRQNDSDFFRDGPLRMIIPVGSGMDYLLGLCDARRNDIIFAHYSGSKLYQTEIKTLSQVQGIVAEITGLEPVVGGRYTDFGFPASVQFSTWFKVKKLFE